MKMLFMTVLSCAISVAVFEVPAERAITWSIEASSTTSVRAPGVGWSIST